MKTRPPTHARRQATWLGVLLVLFVLCFGLLVRWSEPVSVLPTHDGNRDAADSFSDRWPLLPSEDSILNIYNEAGYNEALKRANAGDMDAMLGLISWFNGKDDKANAQHWIQQLDATRASRGLPSYLDGLQRPPDADLDHSGK